MHRFGCSFVEPWRPESVPESVAGERDTSEADDTTKDEKTRSSLASHAQLLLEGERGMWGAKPISRNWGPTVDLEIMLLL